MSIPVASILALFALGCGSHAAAPTSSIAPAITITPKVIEIPPPPPVALAPAIPVRAAEVVRFTRSTIVRREPRADGAALGIIGKGARAQVQQTAPAGEGCATRWLELAPRGWTCDTHTEPTTLPATRATAAAITDDDPSLAVTGTYGVVRGKDVVAFASAADAKAGEGRPLVGKHSVRATGSVRIDGKRYWRTSGGDLIAASSIARMSPSSFRGVLVEDPARMPAWVRAHGDPRAAAVTRVTPSARGKIAGRLAARTVVTVHETSGAFARIDGGVWIARRDLREATASPAPDGTGEHERWFDIDLEEQTLVAYEGARPVYATMVSTGKYGHATPTLVTRIASKLERTTMTSNKDDIYSVADVPWTMFYDGNYALHSSYWHDGFGAPRSHGCINLAPHDARRLFRWSSPDVPPGWVAVYGDEHTPGSLVRVRAGRASEPRFRGYALRVHAATRRQVVTAAR